MESVVLYFQTTLQIVIILLIFLGIGYFITKIFQIKQSKTAFSLLFLLWIGQLFFTIIGAMIFTKGNTSLVLALPILFFLLYQIKTNTINISYNSNHFKFILIYFFISIIFITLWNHLKYYNNDLNRYITANADFIFYAKVSDYIINTGIERNNLNYLTEINYNIPYHYYDLWQNALLAKLFDINYLSALITLTYPLNYSLVYLGIFSLLEFLSSYNKNKLNYNQLVLFFITLLTFFSTSFYHESMKKFIIQIDIVSIDIFETGKLFPIYISYFFIYYAILNRNEVLFFLSLIICGLLYPTTMPAFYVICLLVILFNVIFINRKDRIKGYAFFLFLSLVSYVLFYKFTGNNIKNDAFFSSILQINLGDLIKMFIIPFATIFFVLVLYFPYLLLIKSKILFDKFYIKNSFYFMIAILAISLTFWAVGNKAQNSVQLFYNPFTPVLHVFLYLSILTVYLFADKKWIYITTLILLVNVSVNAHKIFFDKPSKNDKDFVLKVAKAVEQKNRIGAFIFSPEYYLNNMNNFFSKVYFVYPPASFLSYFDTQYHPISLSIFDTKYDSTSKFFQTEKLLMENSEFYQFVETQKKNNQFKSILQSQVDFIKKYNIQWLVTDKDARLPSEIEEIVTEKFTSDIQKYNFYILDPTKIN